MRGPEIFSPQSLLSSFFPMNAVVIGMNSHLLFKPTCDYSEQMKIQGQNKQMLAAACQMFMGKSEHEIAQIALETLEGHQRAIIAHLTVEVRIRDLEPPSKRF